MTQQISQDERIYYLWGEQVEAASAEEAVKKVLTADAKKRYGRKAFCYSARSNSRCGNVLYYEGTIVKPFAGGYDVLENNVQITVRVLPERI